jgi:hypothetical protein
VNRILTDLQQRGVITIDNHVLVIRRPEVLRRRAGWTAST